MKIKPKRKEARALLRLLGESDEAEDEHEDTRLSKPTDKDDPFPTALGPSQVSFEVGRYQGPLPSSS